MKNVYLLCSLLLLGIPLSAQVPYQVKIINSDGADARPERMIPYNGKLLFRARTADNGVEPWISDGTEAGTFLLRDINDDPTVATGNSNPDNFILFNGLVYFKARDASNGDELWVTDGTPGGTQLLKDIHPAGNGNPFDFVLFNDLLFFTANDGANSSELWVSDGTAEGTSLFLDINPAGGTGNPNFKAVIGEYLYFAANNGSNGTEVWRSDGTLEGTMMIKDIRPGTANSLPSRFFAFNGEVYFRANDGTTGTELWKTDGTEVGTVLVKDIRPGSGNSNPDNFFISRGSLYFSAENGTNGVELWVTDGTEEGTTLAIDINAVGNGNPANLLELVPGVFLMTANNGISGVEPWTLLIFGEEVFADPLADINPGAEGSNPSFFVDNGYGIYFSATSADTGKELYVVEVDSGVPERISDINPGAGDGKVEELTRVGDRIFFRADNGTDGLQLWAIEAPIAQLLVTDGEEPLLPGAVVDFGEVVVGETATREINLVNTGGALLVLFDEGALALEAFYAELNELEIPTGDSATMLIEFFAESAGDYEEELLIISFSAANKVYPILLRATAVEAVAVAGITENGVALNSGTTLDFGTVEVGTDSTRVLSIRNSGNAVLNLTDIQLVGGSFNVSPLPGTIAPDGMLNLEIQFAPSSTGPHTGSLSFGTNDPNLPFFSLNFSGEGVSFIPGISVLWGQGVLPSGSTVDFGTVAITQDSVRSFLLNNPGNALLSISNAALSGSDFTITGLPESVPAFGAAAFEVRFTPSEAGMRTGSLVFNTNVPDATAFALNFEGVGEVASSIVEPTAFGAEVFPNPVGEALFVRFQQSIAEGTATLLTANGQRIIQVSLAQQELLRIDLKSLPAGVYILRLSDASRAAYVRVLKQ